MRMAGAGSAGTRFRMMQDLIVLWCLVPSHFMSFEHDSGVNKNVPVKKMCETIQWVLMFFFNGTTAIGALLAALTKLKNQPIIATDY